MVLPCAYFLRQNQRTRALFSFFEGCRSLGSRRLKCSGFGLQHLWFCYRRWLRGYSHRHYGEAESGGKRRGAEKTDPIHGRKYGRLPGSRHRPAQEVQPSALAPGRISGVSPQGRRESFPIEG